MPRMSVKQAIAVAKSFVIDVLADEEPMNVGLEEVEFDDRHDNWLVTIGFSRPWNHAGGPLAGLGGGPAERAYRVVTVSDADGMATAMKRRDEIEAHA